MNIFHVLSQGKSRLHEPSMSAMLGYLLDSSEDHGLGDTFIRAFLDKVGSERFSSNLSSTFINSRTLLEEPYQLDGVRKDIDIQVSIFDENTTNETHKIIIENKIRVGAANPKQLDEYYRAILQDDPDIKSLTMVFLTPKTPSKQLIAEFENLLISPIHKKSWIYWDSESEDGIVSLIRKVLTMESVGEINPINEYMRHTLKAFIKHVISIVQPAKSGYRTRGEDLGDVVDEATIKLSNGVMYRIVRRDSTQTQAYREDTGEKEPARSILQKYLSENGIANPYPTGGSTRQLGNLFFTIRKQQT